MPNDPATLNASKNAYGYWSVSAPDSWVWWPNTDGYRLIEAAEDSMAQAVLICSLGILGVWRRAS